MTSPGRSIKVEVNIKPQTTRCNLFFKQQISRETYQQQGYDSPYHFVSLSALRISNIGSSLTAVGNRNTISPVRLPGKRFHGDCRRNQRIKRRLRTTLKSQRIRTVYNPHRRTRINTWTIQDTASRCELITTFFRHLPIVILADVHRALHASKISRFLAINTVLRDVIAGLRDPQQCPQRIRCSPRLEFLCQLTPEICISLTTEGSWNAASSICIPGICTGIQAMKRRPCSNRKCWCTRMVHNPHRLAIRINAQT